MKWRVMASLSVTFKGERIIEAATAHEARKQMTAEIEAMETDVADYRAWNDIEVNGDPFILVTKCGGEHR